MQTYYIITPSNKDLQHHGRLGQKWGKKNGPPYPLSRNQLSFAEKRKKRADEYEKKKQYEYKNRPKNVSNTKKVAGVLGLSATKAVVSIGSGFITVFLTGSPAAAVGVSSSINMGLHYAGVDYLYRKGIMDLNEKNQFVVKFNKKK